MAVVTVAMIEIVITMVMVIMMERILMIKKVMLIIMTVTYGDDHDDIKKR